MSDKPEREKIDGVEYGTFEGKNGKQYPTISIPTSPDQDGKGWPMTFGVSKAKAIVAYFEDIKAFADADGAPV